MKTSMIVGATVLGTAAVFSAGGLVAVSFMKQATPETQAVAPVSPAPKPVVAQVTSAPEPVVVKAPEADVMTTQAIVDYLAPDEQPQSEPEVLVSAVSRVEPVVQPKIAELPEDATPLSTAKMIADLLAQPVAPAAEDDVVTYEFVSASQSQAQFDLAIPERLRNAVIAALDNGRSLQDLESMVSSAIELGLVETPEALTLTDGSADARSILLSIVNDHEAATGKSFLKTSLLDESLQNTGRNQTYIVEPGDSLAYIALKFYGNTADYRVIFNANRTSLGRPDQIKVGQRLVIPAI